MTEYTKIVFASLRRIAVSSVLVLLVFAAQVPSAQALLIGAGQTATVDFDFGTASGGVLFSFEITTSGDLFDDPAGTLVFEFLDMGIPGIHSANYNAPGGFASLGVISSFITPTDLTGSLRFGTLGESINVASFKIIEIVDDVGTQLVGPTTLLPEPGPLATFGLGLIGFALIRRRRQT